MADETYRYYIPWISTQQTEMGLEVRHGHYSADFSGAIQTYEDVLSVRREVAEHFKIEDPERITLLNWKRLQ